MCVKEFIMRYLLGLVVLLCISIPSRADSFMFSFSGAGFSGSGMIEASQLTTSNIFLISSLSGMMNGQSILDTPNTQGVVFHGVNDSWGLDPTGSGIFFTDASGISWGLFLFDNPVRDVLFNNGSGFRTQVQLNIARVPEPSTWAMLVVALALITLFLRLSPSRRFQARKDSSKSFNFAR
jgi:glucose dehydrogenase